jgi:hypothetical protein
MQEKRQYDEYERQGGRAAVIRLKAETELPN